MKIAPVPQGQVIDLNNQAVAYLQAGKSGEAMASLRMAASILRDRFPEAKNDDDNNDEVSTTSSTTNTTTTTSSNTSETTPGTSHMPSDETTRLQKDETLSTTSSYSNNTRTTTTTGVTTTGSNNSDMDIEVDEEEEHEVYEAVMPLIYSVPASLDTSSTNGNRNNKTTSKISSSSCSFLSYNRALVVSPLLQDAEVMSGVILYNMGLVNHVHGIRRGLSAFVDQALRLYQTGLIIMQTCYNEGIDEDNDEIHFLSTSLVLLALLNNSAQIYSHLIQREGLSYSLGCMRRVLGSTNPAGLNPIVRRIQQLQQQQQQADEQQANDEYESYSFFYMNTMVYSVADSLAFAPAA